MDRKPKAAFEDQKDLVARRACVQRCTDLAARASFIEGCARAVQGEEDQFHFLARKNAAGPRVCSDPQQQFRSFGIPFLKFVERRAHGFAASFVGFITFFPFVTFRIQTVIQPVATMIIPATTITG
jgi:hypothetical protein